MTRQFKFQSSNISGMVKKAHLLCWYTLQVNKPNLML